MSAGGREAFVGALSGAIFGPFGTGETLGGKMLLGATTNAFESIVRQKLNGQDIDWGVVAGDGIFGGLTAGAFHYGGKALKGASPYVKKAFNNVSSKISENAKYLKTAFNNMINKPNKSVVLGSNLGNVYAKAEEFAGEFKKVKTESKIFKELDSKVTEKVNSYLEQIHDKRNLSVTRDTVGPAVAGVYNKVTNKYYYGINNMKGELPEIVHPYILNKIDTMPKEVLESYKKTLGAGTHAECNALNEALIDEFKFINKIEGNVTQEMLDEQYDVLKNMDISNNYISVQNIKKFKGFLPEVGMPMPRCIHCQYVTNGAIINEDMIKAEQAMKLQLEELLHGK